MLVSNLHLLGALELINVEDILQFVTGKNPIVMFLVNSLIQYIIIKLFNGLEQLWYGGGGTVAAAEAGRNPVPAPQRDLTDDGQEPNETDLLVP